MEPLESYRISLRNLLGAALLWASLLAAMAQRVLFPRSVLPQGASTNRGYFSDVRGASCAWFLQQQQGRGAIEIGAWNIGNNKAVLSWCRESSWTPPTRIIILNHLDDITAKVIVQMTLHCPFKMMCPIQMMIQRGSHGWCPFQSKSIEGQSYPFSESS